MTAIATPRSDIRGAAVELAASILTVQRYVGQLLTGQRPSVGLIQEQARAAFSTVDWDRLVGPAAAGVLALCPAGSAPGGLELAPEYTAELGRRLDADAAAALADAMDLQVSRGQHPDVAWQRAVTGYGLTGPAMRSYVSAVLSTGSDGSTTPLSTAKVMARTALLAQADRIGTREAAAWSTLPATAVAKAYDPQEARDETGRWTAVGAKPRGKMQMKQERAAPDAVDAVLADAEQRYTAVPEDDDRYSTKYAARYGTRYGTRYAKVPAESGRYSGRYGTSSNTRYQGEATPAAAAVNRVFLFGAMTPSQAPPPEPYVDADGFSLYLPMNRLRAYYDDTGRDLGTVTGRNSGTSVDFAGIEEHLTQVRGDPEPIELHEDTSPWAVAQGVEDIDPDNWTKILAKAVPLWHDVQEEPLRAADQLSNSDLHILAERAGYPPTMRTEQIREEIKTNYEMRENGVERRPGPGGTDRHYDPGLLDALADYVVWDNPRSWGAEGIDLARDLEYGLDDVLEDAPVPEVMSFGSRLAHDEDGGRMHGQYSVTAVQYHSAIGEFGGGAPVGKTALREIHVKPERM